MIKARSVNPYLIAAIILTGILLYFPLFLHLDYWPIRLWDESRLALSAYEMHVSGEPWVTTYGGEPDMWNNKPPFMIWAQVISIKVFGINELAIRMPSAMASLIVCGILLILGYKWMLNYWFGFIAVMVLITSEGFIGFHTSRTGDYDAMLTLFMVAYSVCFYLFIEKKAIKYLHLFFLFLGLAVFTKSIQAFLFLPGLLLFSILRKQIPTLLKNKWLYFDFLIMTLILAAYFIYREIDYPGFLQAVWDTQIGGRYLDTIEGHQYGFWYYFSSLINNRYIPWFFLVPIGIGFGVFSKNERLQIISSFSAIMAVSYLIIVSISQTKLAWYDMPAYPWMAIVVAVPIYLIFEWLSKVKRINVNLKFNIIPAIFLLSVFSIPYFAIINSVYFPKEKGDAKQLYAISYYLKDAIANAREINGAVIVYHEHNQHLWFYVKVLEERGQVLQVKLVEDVQIGETVLVSHPDVKKFIEEKYNFDTIEEKNQVKIYKVHGLRQ